MQIPLKKAEKCLTANRSWTSLTPVSVLQYVVIADRSILIHQRQYIAQNNSY